MISAFRGFGRYVAVTRANIGGHFYSMWALGIVAAAFEGVGILLFVPILTRLASEDAAPAEGMLAGALERWAEGRSIEALLLMMVGLFTAKGLLVFVVGSYRVRVFNRSRERMRTDVFERLGRVRIRDIEAKRLGALGNLLVREIDSAGHAMDRVCAAIGSLTTATLLFVVAVVLHPPLAAVLAASGLVSLLLTRRFSRARAAISRRATSAAGRLASLSVEGMQAFKYLRATGRFPVVQRAFARAAGAARAIDDRAAVVDWTRVAIREPLLVMWIGAVFYIFVVSLRQSLGVITDGILFFYRVSIELMWFQDYWHDAASSIGSIDAYERLRSELDRAAEPEDHGTPFRFDESIRLERVAFRYGAKHVVRGLDLTIEKRQTVAIVGTSGAGKSTLLDLIAGCVEPDEGAVMIDDADLRAIRGLEYRAALGYVTQESVVFSGSVARNVTMRWDRDLDDSTLERAREAARLANCLELIEGLEDGWDSELGERGHRRSGGERQRIAIARELYREPELLILDEATSALDSVSERAVQRSLELLHGRLTVLIVAHRLSTIRHASVIHVLEGGRIVESGKFDELVNRDGGRFRALCQMQSLV